MDQPVFPCKRLTLKMSNSITVRERLQGVFIIYRCFIYSSQIKPARTIPVVSSLQKCPTSFANSIYVLTSLTSLRKRFIRRSRSQMRITEATDPKAQELFSSTVRNSGSRVSECQAIGADVGNLFFVFVYKSHKGWLH